MSFDVRRSDADAFAAHMGAWASSAIAALEQVGVAGELAICGLGISGRASEASAAYWREVHAPIIFAANAILQELLARYGRYLGDLSALDGARDARFGSDALERGGTDMASIHGAHDERAGGLSEILADISDIVCLEAPSSSVLVGTLGTLESAPRILSDEVASVEERHAASARELADRMDALRAALEGAGSVGSFESYVPGAARSAGWLEALGRASGASAAFCGENAQAAASALDGAYDRSGKRAEEEARLAAERADGGTAQMIFGSVAVGVGIATIVLSGTAATPFVAPMMAFGAAELAEGSQELYYGANGDTTSVSWNPLRDTVFFGNQGLYDGASFAADLMGGFGMPLSTAAGAAKAAGTPLLKSAPAFAKTFVKEGAKDWVKDQGVNVAFNFTVDSMIDSAFGKTKTAQALKDGSRDLTSALMPDFGIGKKRVSSGAAGEADTSGVRIFKEGFPLVNGPYIKDGKPNGRPKLWGKKKLEFEWAVYNAQLDGDGVLRDPYTKEVIDWKPGQPRKGVCDFGHKKTKYSEIFEMYRTGEISLERLKEIQFNPRNFQIQTINSNRSHRYEGL